ncbi:MAG: lipopolysaccharide transport system ATP-binding protein [Solirubrobacteraceae bacterium]|nr:lipopolysaccharide transport system ATP-binding protein [Solirubrobacteraceae bacterium]
MPDVLRLDRVWKGYRSGATGPRTLRSSIVGGDLVRRMRAPLHWALRDVSLTLGAGESLGIVGRNGAGKSTLLRLASQLGRPTRGALEVHPDTASVLNLGASFDLQLTGRENAYTAALVAGFTAAETRRLLPEALAFAELEDFADAPVRTYSDGMKLRLAFGVVAVRRPALLVLDEVLAVGDVGFRRKCEDRIAEMREEGTSLVLVSHSADEVVGNCDRAVWLQRGEVRATGEAEVVVERYEEAARAETLARTPAGLGHHRFGSQEVRIESVRVRPTEVRGGGPLDLELDLASERAIGFPLATVQLRREADEELVVDASTGAPGVVVEDLDERGTLRVRVERLDLVPGRYALDVGVYAPDWAYAFDFHWEAAMITVTGPTGGKGVLVPPVRWSSRAA